MKTYLDCFPCFFEQAVDTSRMLNADEGKIREIIYEISKIIPEFPESASPSEIGRELYRIISEKTGVEDPFLEIKKEYIKLALSLYPNLKNRVNSSEDR